MEIYPSENKIACFGYIRDDILSKKDKITSTFNQNSIANVKLDSHLDIRDFFKLICVIYITNKNYNCSYCIVDNTKIATSIIDTITPFSMNFNFAN